MPATWSRAVGVTLSMDLLSGKIYLAGANGLKTLAELYSVDE